MLLLVLQLLSAPDMPVAQAAPAQAIPAMAEAVGGGGGGMSATPGIDEDLQVSSDSMVCTLVNMSIECDRVCTHTTF